MLDPAPNKTVNVNVNGVDRSDSVSSRSLLSDFLRDDLGLTSVKRGCETGKCGACTVVMDERPVKSCSVLAGQANGKTIQTVEGLDDELGSVIKSAFKRNHALQCGFCTSGFLMSALALLEENPDPDRDDIREGLQGNICRCTGYTRIIQAVEDASTRVDTVNYE